ncbi:MAG TPA: tetratricopeptide repeat protein, partial [Alphaproteobacteria bacterium]|nr:tetratricopeptide repeat protein [Alphaproteobacteria bacterium]
MIVSIRKNTLLAMTALSLIAPAITACSPANTDTSLETGATPLEKKGSILYGDKREKLSVIKSLHTKSPDDPLIAARYGKALREAGQIKSAKSILIPLASNKEVATLANTELSAVYLSEANFEKAESSARKAIKADKMNYRAWRNLGNALDAQEEYKEGEEAFRKALELWADEDKVPVMNNLALNLAAQGYTDKALTMLYDAQKMDPNRVEIERNIRIIRTLNEPPE